MSEYCSYTYHGYPSGLKYPWEFTLPSEKERDRRWQAVRKSMKKHKLDCLVAGVGGFAPPTAKNIYYISNYVPFAGRSTFLVFPLVGEPQLVVSGELGPQFYHIAYETSWVRDIVSCLYPEQEFLKKIRSLKLENGTLGLMGYRFGSFSALAYNALREAFPSATLVDAASAFVEATIEVSRTSEEELSLLKRACDIMDLSYEAVAKALKPGVKECDLWGAAEQSILSNGGWYPHFLLATSGPRPTFPRFPPSTNTLNRGDVVIFEVNANYGGIAPQSCYALSLGKPDSEVEAMFKLGEELYWYALPELEKNRTLLDVENDLACKIHDAGYEPMTPQMHVYNFSGVMPMGNIPQSGDYFVVHPNMCNKDFTAGAKLGDCVRINKAGKVERLQRTPPKLNVIRD